VFILPPCAVPGRATAQPALHNTSPPASAFVTLKIAKHAGSTDAIFLHQGRDWHAALVFITQSPDLARGQFPLAGCRWLLGLPWSGSQWLLTSCHSLQACGELLHLVLEAIELGGYGCHRQRKLSEALRRGWLPSKVSVRASRTMAANGCPWLPRAWSWA
jgi:hypothetical protein